MNEKQINDSVKQAFNRATPDVLDAVLSDCPVQKGTVIVMKKKNNWIKWLGAAAAVLALLIGIGSYRENAVASTISLDVNPSISITVNHNERVLDVKALNEDAKIVLGDMELKGNDVEVAVNALIGSMVRNGYLNEITNSILVSVDSRNAAAGEALQEKLTKEINTLLTSDRFTGAVLSQTVNKESELQALADQYGITLGKAQLIQQIVKQDSRYQFEELVMLSINELNLISESGKLHLDNITSEGTASDKGYVGADAARDIALQDAGATLEQAVKLKVEMDYHHSAMIYEVEFDFDNTEFDYDIDAKTGNVLQVKREPCCSDTQTGDSDALISKDAALDAALAHACVTKDQILDVSCELDESKLCYEVEFNVTDCEYEYHIDAHSGSVLHHTKVYDKDHHEEHNDHPHTVPGVTVPQVITQDAAVSAALAHAGLSVDAITELEVELDSDDGVLLYEVEFENGGMEYSYEINAKTGEVVKYEKERD